MFLSGLNWKFNPEMTILLATPDPPELGRIWYTHGSGFLRKPDPIFRNGDPFWGQNGVCFCDQNGGSFLG